MVGTVCLHFGERLGEMIPFPRPSPAGKHSPSPLLPLGRSMGREFPSPFPTNVPTHGAAALCSAVAGRWRTHRLFRLASCSQTPLTPEPSALTRLTQVFLSQEACGAPGWGPTCGRRSCCSKPPGAAVENHSTPGTRATIMAAACPGVAPSAHVHPRPRASPPTRIPAPSPSPRASSSPLGPGNCIWIPAACRPQLLPHRHPALLLPTPRKRRERGKPTQIISKSRPPTSCSDSVNLDVLELQGNE